MNRVGSRRNESGRRMKPERRMKPGRTTEPGRESELRRIFKRIGQILLQAVFPLRCPVCDKIVQPAGEKICVGCMDKLRIITPPWCMRCGKKLAEEGEYCAECRVKEHSFIRGRALYEYTSASQSIYRFKYGRRQEYADYFGEQMVE